MINVTGKLSDLARDADKCLLIAVLLAILGSASPADASPLAITVLALGLFAPPGFMVLRSFRPCVQ